MLCLEIEVQCHLLKVEGQSCITYICNFTKEVPTKNIKIQKRVFQEGSGITCWLLRFCKLFQLIIFTGFSSPFYTYPSLLQHIDILFVSVWSPSPQPFFLVAFSPWRTDAYSLSNRVIEDVATCYQEKIGGIAHADFTPPTILPGNDFDQDAAFLRKLLLLAIC